MMTKEEKELLLKVLCSMLPYGVLCKSGNEILPLKDVCINGAVGNEGQLRLGNCKYGGIYKSIDEVKPYLRPMSSMTEEEDKKWQLYKNNIACSCDENLNEKINELHDWFNEHHFDYRGLIKKGFALEAPENMYKL